MEKLKKLAWAKQEPIIHALPVSNITQKVINMFRLAVLRSFSGITKSGSPWIFRNVRNLSNTSAFNGYIARTTVYD